MDRVPDSNRANAVALRPILLFIDRLGRPGGLLLLSVGAASIVLGAHLIATLGPWNGEAVWSPAGLGLAVFLCVEGPVLALKGVAQLLKGAPPDFRMSDDALRALLREGRPLTLCLECRTTILGPPCEHCHQSSTAFEVRRPVDAENARALLGLDDKVELS